MLLGGSCYSIVTRVHATKHVPRSFREICHITSKTSIILVIILFVIVAEVGFLHVHKIGLPQSFIIILLFHIFGWLLTIFLAIKTPVICLNQFFFLLSLLVHLFSNGTYRVSCFGSFSQFPSAITLSLPFNFYAHFISWSDRLLQSCFNVCLRQ